VKPRFSMLIRWSDEDEAYIVTLPEFDNAKTHGDTYEEAARQGSDLIDSFLMWSAQDDKPLPAPRLFVFPGEKLRPSVKGSVGQPPMPKKIRARWYQEKEVIKGVRDAK